MATHSVEFLFIGGGLANATAAREARQRNPSASIRIVGGESHPPYHRPPLSKEFLRGEVGFDAAQVAPSDQWAALGIDLTTGASVASLDLADKTAQLSDGSVIGYEQVCIATGSKAKRFTPADVPGSDAPNVLTLRTVDDSEKLKTYLVPGTRLIIAGAGYIGMEAAACARQKGAEVTIIDPGTHPWGKFASPAFGDFLRRYYEAQGVLFRIGDQVAQIETGTGGLASAVQTKNGERLPCDAVLVGIGAALNLELPQQAGLTVDPKEGVSTDEFLQASDAPPGVYVAGDIARFRDPILGKSWHAEHWQNALWHGEIVGANLVAGISGERTAYNHVPYFFSDEFDLHMTLRGDPQAGKESFFIGSTDLNTERFTELYLRPDGTLAMGIVLSRNEDESAASELLEQLVRRAILIAPHKDALTSGQMALEALA